MEQQLGINAPHGLEWQIILTENETVIVRRPNPVLMPAKPSVVEVSNTQATPSTRSAAPSHPRIYANMR